VGSNITLLRDETVRQPIGDLSRDLLAVALANPGRVSKDDMLQLVALDDVAQLAGVRVQPCPGAKRGGLRKNYDRLSIRNSVPANQTASRTGFSAAETMTGHTPPAPNDPK
jgi:hypothetical protein